MNWICGDKLSLIQHYRPVGLVSSSTHLCIHSSWRLRARCCQARLRDNSGRTSQGKAKTLWQQGFRGGGKKNLVLSTSEDQPTETQLPIEALKGKIEIAGLHIDRTESRLIALENHDLATDKAIRQLQHEQNQALSSKAKLQQEMLLGQIAYTVSDVLEDFIFGEVGSSSLLPLGISDLANNNVELSEEEQARWVAAKAFLTSTMPLKEIVEADRYLRWLSSKPADGKSQIRETTAADLHTWAGLYCKAKAVVPVQRYMQVLNQLSTSARPLAPNKSLATVVQRM